MASELDTDKGKSGSITAIARPVPEEPSAVEELRLKPARDITRATWTIVGGVALPCIPIIIITAVLLYYIFRHRLILSPGWPALQIAVEATHRNATQFLNQIRQQGGDKAYYVQYNASTITTIASWTGRVVPYLSSSIMALVAFYAARHIVLKSKHGDGSNLPSPGQLTILISVLGGNGFGPLKDTLFYRFGKKEKLASPLPAAFAALFIITLLGILIPFLDSWFGIATKTVTVTQLYPRESVLSYGRGLSTSVCPNGPRDVDYPENCLHDANAWWPCNIVIPNCHPALVVTGIAEASKISLGVSQVHQIYNYTDISGNIYYYLGDPAQSAKVDYQAKTIATSSQCVPMTELCLPQLANGTYNPFTCTSGFIGNLYDSQLNTSATDYSSNPNYINVGLAFSENPQLTKVGGQDPGFHFGENVSSWSVPQIYPTNPLYYGTWAVGYPPGDPLSNLNFTGDTGIYYETGSSTGGIWLMNCSTTVHEVNYTWINGAVRTFNHTLASTDMSALLSAPFATAPNYAYMFNALALLATVAGNTNSSRAMATSFAEGFSKALLAYSNGAMGAILNEFEQDRNSTISVARIPIIPLYLLLATKAIYVLAVIILAIGAYCFTHPAETEMVKAQLSMKGLAAAHFQQPDLAQQNVVKELQSRIDAAKGNAGPPTPDSEGPSPKKGLGRAATAPVHGSENPEAPSKDVKVGLLPAADGTWQFVVLANGVWNSIKPIVENLVVADANSGGLGTMGEVINAWK